MKAMSASRADGWWEVEIGHESQPVFHILQDTAAPAPRSFHSVTN